MLPDPHSYQHRDDTMKPGSVFSDNINQVAQWFSKLNDVERTIACYLLLQDLKPTQARFLSLVLEHKFRENAYEVQKWEKYANDRESLILLRQESIDVAIEHLLRYILLLHPGNEEAMEEYHKLIYNILVHSVENSIHEEDCKHLLSLVAVHPAFVQQGQGQAMLKFWRELVNDKADCFKQRHRITQGLSPSHTCDSHLYNGGKTNDFWHSGNTVNTVTKPHVNGWRQRALVHRDSGIEDSFDRGANSPGATTSSVTCPLDDSTFDEFGIVNRVGRSRSFPVDPAHLHRKVSPQSSVDSDEDSISKKGIVVDNISPGMKDVPMWLKSLRLHKYTQIFTELTYDQMLNLKGEYLDSKGVTLGARNKILIFTEKLKERGQTLLNLEKEVLVNGKLQSVLADLKQILISPIPPYIPTEGSKTDCSGAGLTGNIDGSSMQASQQDDLDINDLPSLIVRVMGKACTQILVNRLDEDSCVTYLGLLDRVLSHEAFTPQQKRRMHPWKMQCQKLAKALAASRKVAGIEKGPKNWYDPLGHSSVPGNCRRRPPSRQTSSLKGTSSTGIPLSARAGPVANVHKKLQPSASFNMVKQHQPVCRTKSAPIRPSPQGLFPLTPIVAHDAEGINKSLESLCIKMTEHALGDSSDRPDNQF